MPFGCHLEDRLLNVRLRVKPSALAISAAERQSPFPAASSTGFRTPRRWEVIGIRWLPSPQQICRSPPPIRNDNAASVVGALMLRTP
jgi:hypothetical protein